MTAIVIRPEPVSVGDGMQIVAANITGLADDPRRLWYRIEPTAQPDEIAVAHALVVSVINAAMALGRDIVVDGPLTRGTVMNLLEYQRIWSAWMPALYRRVAIAARELLPDEPFRPERRFVLPFSGGLDSAHSALVLSETRDLGALMPIHGLEITLADTERWTNTVVGLRA